MVQVVEEQQEMDVEQEMELFAEELNEETRNLKSEETIVGWQFQLLLQDYQNRSMKKDLE